MDKAEIRVSVSKTIQEQQYEPFIVMVEVSKTTIRSGNHYIKMQTEALESKIEEAVNEIIERRLSNAKSTT